MFDGYLVQETHVKSQDLDQHEADLSRIGLKSCFSAARPSTTSSSGALGGVMAAARKQHRVRFFREYAKSGCASGSTAGSLEEYDFDTDENLFEFDDWVPMLWHLKGISVILITLYLRSGMPLRAGPNGRRLKELSTFLQSIRTTWIAAGDFNVSPQEFWRSGWPEAMGDGRMIVPSTDTCFKEGCKPSCIDYAVASPLAAHLVDNILPVSVTWKPHIGQQMVLKAEAYMQLSRVYNMAAPFAHPPKPARAPIADSKRQRRRQAAAASRAAQDDNVTMPEDEIMNAAKTLSDYWETLSPYGWTAPGSAAEHSGRWRTGVKVSGGG